MTRADKWEYLSSYFIIGWLPPLIALWFGLGWTGVALGVLWVLWLPICMVEHFRAGGFDE